MARKFFLQNNNVITEYVEFVGEIDIIQSCVYVINKYIYIVSQLLEIFTMKMRMMAQIKKIIKKILLRCKRNTTPYYRKNIG